VHEGALDGTVAPTEYFPLSQTGDSSFTLVVRTRQDAAALLPELVAMLHRIDSNLGVSDEGTLLAKIEGTQAALLHRFAAWLIGGFAGFALVLASLGIYAVISYSVSQRTQEIGIRMALGASAETLQKSILLQTLGLAGIGMIVGIVASLALARLLSGLLYGVTASDPVAFLAMLVILTSVAAVAGYLPARRASRIDPMSALRMS
ncbi:MAG: FtsX-like permease family protein, partial [Chthoniobacterales bacterium]